MSVLLPRLSPDPSAPFPDPHGALREPDGLLAYGGDLQPTRLVNAYSRGIFPWYSEGQPILWWSPDPRLVFDTGAIHLSTRFRRSLRRSEWQVTADTAFAQVVAACASAPRPGQDGTWITAAMQQAYAELHALGHAHSVEVWDGRELVGGIYGVAVGRMFFGESMVSLASGGSKVALAALADTLHGWGWPLLDAQVENAHLLRLGARPWPRRDFLRAVADQASQPGRIGSWSSAVGRTAAAGLAGPAAAG